MSYDYPFPSQEGIRSIGVSIILCILTCGLYGFYWQYKQIQILNAWIGREEFSFLIWLLIGIITCGIFMIYYEYKMARGINEIQERNDFRVNNDIALICLVLTLFGLGIVSMAIQQAEINKFYGENPDL